MTTSISIDFLADEQVRKRAVGVEDVDQGGLVRRQRVLDQTIFDRLFLGELINQVQYESSCKMLEMVSRSGSSIRSANLDTEVFTPYKDVGNLMGERRMAFSAPYRRVVRDCGLATANFMMKLFADVYTYPKSPTDRERIAAALFPALDSLASYFDITSVEDPRAIVRSMVYSRK